MDCLVYCSGIIILTGKTEGNNFVQSDDETSYLCSLCSTAFSKDLPTTSSFPQVLH